MKILTILKSYKADWLDVGLIKIAVFAATLFLAKLWKPLLSLEWYWYLALWIITAIKPFVSAFKWLFKAHN